MKDEFLFADSKLEVYQERRALEASKNKIYHDYDIRAIIKSYNCY